MSPGGGVGVSRSYLEYYGSVLALATDKPQPLKEEYIKSEMVRIMPTITRTTTVRIRQYWIKSFRRSFQVELSFDRRLHIPVLIPDAVSDILHGQGRDSSELQKVLRWQDVLQLRYRQHPC